jgi:urease accessory protein
MVLVIGLVAASGADAHGGFQGVGTFYAGLLHPLAVSAHLVALLAIGVLCGQRGWAFVVDIVPAVAAATVVGLSLARPEIEPVAGPLLLAAAGFTGLAVALELKLPAAATSIWAAVVGGVVGIDSPAQLAAGSSADRWIALSGTGLGVLLLFAWCATPVARIDVAWQRIGIRVLGSWLSAGAVLSLVLLATGRGA